jgi:hypothetical protein
MKASLMALVSALLLGAIVPPSEAHAACATGQGLEDLAWDFAWNYMHNVALECDSSYQQVGNCLPNHQHTMTCSQHGTPRFWQIKLASQCGLNQTLMTTQIWYRPTTEWVWFTSFSCGCNAQQTGSVCSF